MQAGRWLEQERTRRKCIFNGDRSTIGNSKDVYMMLEFDKKVENYDAVEATSTNVDEGKNGNSSTPVSSTNVNELWHKFMSWPRGMERFSIKGFLLITNEIHT